MTVDALVHLIQQMGPLLGVVLFFIWRDWQRETKMSLRVTKLEDERQGMLIEIVEKSTLATAQSAASLDRVSRTLERICDRVGIIE